MGNRASRKLKVKKDKVANEKKIVNLKRTSGLDGKNKGLKICTGVLTCSWKQECPQISILNDTIKIEDQNNNLIQIQGNQEKVEIGGFQMKTLSLVQEDGKKTYCLGIDTKTLNLATFEVEVEKNGTITLRGRKLRESKEGQLKIFTAQHVTSSNILIEAAENNRIVWIRIYYEFSNEKSLNEQVSMDDPVDASTNELVKDDLKSN